MKASAKSLVVFGIYLVGMGVGFVFMPNVLLGLLGFPATDEVWSRVVGMLALVLAVYYIQAARTDLQPFMRWTVVTRVAVFFFFTAFVVGGLAGPMMILLGVVDLLSALWTAWALHTEKKTTVDGANGLTKQATR